MQMYSLSSIVDCFNHWILPFPTKDGLHVLLSGIFSSPAFFTGDAALIMYYTTGLLAKSGTVCYFERSLCCWLAASSSRKLLVSRLWLPTTVVSGDAGTHNQASPSFSRALLPERSCSCPLLSVVKDVPLGVVFLSKLLYPELRQFGHCSTSKVELLGLVENLANADMKRE